MAKKAEKKAETPEARAARKKPLPISEEDFKPDPKAKPLDPAYGRNLPLPASGDPVFTVKARVYGIKGRDGKGPCKVSHVGPVAMPNGDIAAAAKVKVNPKTGEITVVKEGDTFDPVVEGFTAKEYRLLVESGHISAADDKTEAALVKKDKARAEAQAEALTKPVAKTAEE